MNPIRAGVTLAFALATLPVLAAPPSPSTTAPLVLQLAGKTVRTLTSADISALVPAQEVEVFEPHEGVNRRYVGVPARALMEAVYGRDWKSADDVLFTCADGYQPAVPAAKFARYEAWIVWKRADGQPFGMKNKTQNDEAVELGPFYLVWDNVRAPALKAEAGVDWPYQVVGIDLVDFASRFPRLAPPPKSSAAAKRGFVAFRTHCLACHTLNGEGGGKAVELNYPANVTEYYREEWLRRWIDQPTAVRFNTNMPALPPDLPERSLVIDDLVAYLRSMAKAKSAPPGH